MMTPAGSGRRGLFARRSRLEELERELTELQIKAEADADAARAKAQMQKETGSALLDLAYSLALSGSVEEVCARLAEAVPSVTGARFSAVLTYSPENRTLIPRASQGLSVEQQALLNEIVVHPDDTPYLDDLLQRGLPATYRRDEIDDPFRIAVLDAFGFFEVIDVPVLVNGSPVAVIAAMADGDGFGLPEEVLQERLAGLAEQSWRAFESAALLERQRERLERLSGQKEILEMVALGADLREILDALCLTVEEQLDGAACGILLLDQEGETLQTVSAPSLPRDLTWSINGMKPGPFSCSAGSAVYREESVFVRDVMTDPLWTERKEIALEHGIRAAWAVPIFEAASRRVLGSFCAYLTRPGAPDDHIQAFMDMAVQLAAIAIERKGLEEQLTHQAFHDSLTGLPNRALFADRVQHALERTSRQEESIAVLFLDLDNFKAVNDSFGHLAGDMLLKVAADRLKACLRTADTAARLGGDEFAVLLEGTDKRSAMQIAGRILEAMNEPLLLSEAEIRISGSVGLAFSDDGRGHLNDLLRNADTAMYAAKEAGKNRYELFEQRMRSGIVRRLELQTELQRAVDRDEFIVHYQPVYRLHPHQMVGVEALARWNHPTRGIIPPNEFIPMAEETGLIVDIGRVVTEKACAQLKVWKDSLKRPAPLRVGVNFSARQLQSPTLVEEVSGYIDRYAIEPDMLIIEITESVLMHDPDAIAERLKLLRDLGVGVAIDDFGTGYSSLSYLRRFPVTVLKIDRYFVQCLDRGPEDAAYGRAIVRLGNTLDLDVCAEGIETAGEFEALLEMGCDYGQGFLFSQPVPPESIALLPGAHVDENRAAST